MEATWRKIILATCVWTQCLEVNSRAGATQRTEATQNADCPHTEKGHLEK